jgi:hypothetical protein
VSDVSGVRAVGGERGERGEGTMRSSGVDSPSVELGLQVEYLLNNDSYLLPRWCCGDTPYVIGCGGVGIVFGTVRLFVCELV